MPNQGPPHQRLIRVNDVAHIPVPRLQSAIDDDYETLCTVVVAEALGLAPPEIGALLRSPDWAERWFDALLGLSGVLSVAVVRLRYQHGPYRAKTRNNRRRRDAIRARTDQARRLVRAIQAGPAETPGTTVAAKARAWLRDAYPDEFRALFDAAWQATDVPEFLRTAPPSDGEIVWAVQHGVLTAPVGPDVRRLLRLPHVRLRNVVADDAKEQQDRQPALRHPLLVAGWGRLLAELRSMTAAELGYPQGCSGGVPTGQFDLTGWADEDAYAVLNRLRFFAAIEQRRYEQRSLARQLRGVVAERITQAREQAGAGGLVGDVIDALIDWHPGTYALFTFVLHGYAVRGRLTEAFYADPGGIKQDALRQAVERGLLVPADGASGRVETA